MGEGRLSQDTLREDRDVIVARPGWDLVRRDCSTCGEQRAFEALAGADGHGDDCPELACVQCGEAVFLGGFEFEAAADDRAHAPTAA